MLDLCNKHDTDMKLMMDRLHIKSDDAFIKFKQTAISNVNKPPAGAPTSKQVDMHATLFLSVSCNIYNSISLHWAQYSYAKN